jgi:hypothetical protein
MEEVRQAKYTLETLPTKTLLHYVKKDELIRSLPQGAFAELQRQAAQQGQKVTAKFLKDAVLQNQDFANALRGSQLGFQAYQKYMANYQRITAPEVRAKSQQVRREMLEPRRGFVGCVAAKTDPKVFKECAETYNNPEYQSLDLVPSAALKQSAFNKTGSVVLAPKQGVRISDLPHGLKAYIRNHPQQYVDYLEEIRAQAEYLKSLGRNVNEEQRQTKKRFVGEGEFDCDVECDIPSEW